jgi:hypothetical protein
MRCKKEKLPWSQNDPLKILVLSVSIFFVAFLVGMYVEYLLGYEEYVQKEYWI